MLIKPQLQINRITELTVAQLQEMQVDTLILDVDNTLCVRKGEVILEQVPAWLEDMKRAGIHLVILSNSKPNRMRGIAAKLGLPFIAPGLKPLPFGYFRAIQRVGGKVKNTAIVGDQLFTDMLGGHLAFCKTILVCPAELETSIGFRIKRSFERLLLRRYGMKCNF